MRRTRRSPDLGAAFGGFGHQQLSGHYEGFFVGYGDSFTGSCGRHNGGKARGAYYGGDYDVDFAHRGDGFEHSVLVGFEVERGWGSEQQ